VSSFFSATVGPAPALLLLALALTCALTDLFAGKIYNAVTYPAVAIGILTQVVLHGWWGLAGGALGFVVGFFPAFLLFALGGMAGGDVKLLGAVGAIAGVIPVTETLILAFLFGAFFALGKLAWNGVFFRSLWRAGRVLAGLAIPGVKRVPLVEPGQAGMTIRFGVAIALGAVATLWDLHSGAILGLLS
jgi:prepilin peptidase CpaA